MKLNRTTTILLIALVASLGIMGIVLFNANKTDDAVLTETEAAGDAEIVFINLASQIDAIRFDTAFFDDPLFASLVDIRMPVIPEEQGRRDPFAALGR